MGFWPGISMNFSYAARLQRSFGSCSAICLKLMLGGAVNWCRRQIKLQWYKCSCAAVKDERLPERRFAVTPKPTQTQVVSFVAVRFRARSQFDFFAYFINSMTLGAILSSGFRGRAAWWAFTQPEARNQWEEQTVDVSENLKDQCRSCFMTEVTAALPSLCLESLRVSC